MSRASATAGLILAALLCARASAIVPPGAEFVYVDANEDGASGGHVALRIGGSVYHFQQDASGSLAIARDTWSGFEFEYRVVGNRTLHATRLPASAAGTERLRRHFDAQVLLDAVRRQRIDALRDDVALLEVLGAHGGGGYALRGAGFFATDDTARDPAAHAAAVALGRLRERVAREHGPGFAAAREREAAADLRGLRPEASEVGSAAALDSYPFSRRYADGFAALRALEVLREAPPLRRDALRALPAADSRLSSGERVALAEQSAALETELAHLIGSRRPDWGGAFLLGAARLAAAAESLASGQLRVLDAFPAEAPALHVGALPAGALGPRLAWRREQLVAARRAFASHPSSPRTQARLEAAAARYAELASALGDEGGVLRLPPPPLLPQGVARLAHLPRPAFAEVDPAPHTARARARLARAERERAERLGYHLVSRNCVTELFRQVDAALGDGELARRPDVRSPLAFVPFVAEREVRARWAGERETRLSHRRAALAAARARPSARGWLAGLRESNTLTSSLYQSHGGDSIFLFFTDDALLARPLLGAANLAAGLVGAAVGVAQLPWRGTSLLERGLRGSAASVPELFFFNVRKGTFPLALPADAPAPLEAGG